MTFPSSVSWIAFSLSFMVMLSEMPFTLELKNIASFSQNLFHLFVDQRRYKGRDVAVVSVDLFHKGAGDVIELLARHQENGITVRIDLPVHGGHLELDLKVASGPESPDDGT